MWGVPLLVGCGGSTAASPGGGGRAGNEQPNEGAAGTLAMPAMPEPQPGGTSGSPGIPPGGHCTKLCVNTASFVFDSALSSAELFSGSLKACHNGAQECHTGTLPPPDSGANTITFPGTNSWDGPTVWSPDGWRTIEYSWGSTDSMALHDGDRFSLSFVGAKDRLLFEQAVTFEVVRDCAGTCQSARYDLRGVVFGGAGTPGSADAGASSGGAEPGSAGEGGAANR